MTEERRTKEQMSVNFNFLLARLDLICATVAPDFLGTWQQRAEHATFAMHSICTDLADAQARIEELEQTNFDMYMAVQEGKCET